MVTREQAWDNFWDYLARAVVEAEREAAKVKSQESDAQHRFD